MRHPKTKSLYRYWLELFADTAGGRRALPERNAIEPGAIRNLLGDVFILDGASGISRYRIAGTRLCALHGRELRGEAFDTAFDAPDRAGTRTWSGAFGREGCAVLLSSEATSARGERVTLETLLLPLAHEGRDDLRALGITTPAETHEWIGMVPIVQQQVRAARLIRPWEDNVFLANYPFTLPETATAERRHTPPSRAVGHLRVIQGGRAG